MGRSIGTGPGFEVGADELVMIIFLHGEEGFLVNRRRLELQKTFARKYPGADVFIFDFEDQGTIENVRRALAACDAGLFAEQKMVIFLHPFELSETAQETLLNFLQNFADKNAEEVTLLLVHPDKIKKTHTLSRFLEKHSDKTETFPKLQPKDGTSFILRELNAIDAKAKFSSSALRIFSEFIGTDTARIVTELEKLAAFKPGGVFEVGDVSLLIANAAEKNIFSALDALVSGDKKRALLLLRRFAEGEQGAYSVLAMCAWQVRRLLLVREAFDQGARNASNIAAQTKLQSFVVQRMLSAVKNFPLSRIRRGLAMLSDLDTELKRGGMDPLVALDLFVWKF